MAPYNYFKYKKTHNLLNSLGNQRGKESLKIFRICAKQKQQHGRAFGTVVKTWLGTLGSRFGVPAIESWLCCLPQLPAAVQWGEPRPAGPPPFTLETWTEFSAPDGNLAQP